MSSVTLFRTFARARRATVSLGALWQLGPPSNRLWLEGAHHGQPHPGVLLDTALQAIAPLLEENGVRNYVIDPASLQVDRRARDV
jgi:hypothetical protein